MGSTPYDEMRKRYLKAVAERDALKAEVERLKATQPTASPAECWACNYKAEVGTDPLSKPHTCKPSGPATRKAMELGATLALEKTHARLFPNADWVDKQAARIVAAYLGEKP